MAIPDYQSLMLPLLKVAAKGETSVPKAADQIADQMQLSPAEREQLLPSGKQRLLHNRVHWAKFYMAKAGLIHVPKRGRFQASPEGIALLHQNPPTISVETLKGYPSFLQFYAASPDADSESEASPAATDNATSATPEEQIEASYGILQSALQAELLDRILQNKPAFFERLIVDLLVAMGYGGSHESAARKIGRSGDGGVDGVIDEDRLGLDRIYLQAKRNASHVSVHRPEIQGFVGSLVGVGATKGVFVTTSSFSSGAVQYAQHLQQRVILVDGRRLTELMVEHGVGVRLSRSLELKRLDEDFFADE